MDSKKLKISELVDIEMLRELFEWYSRSSELPTALLDLEGNVLIKTNWQEACTNFHRVNKDTCANCLESDTAIASSIEDGHSYNLYKCKNGLVDVATPIKINGEHVANFFIGQFFLEGAPPNLEEFSLKAKEFGFNVDAYINAIKKVPVYKESEVKDHMNFLVKLSEMISLMGAKSKHIYDLNQELKLSNKRHQDLANNMQAMVKVGGWELNVKTMESFWTKGVYDIYGIPYGEPLNKVNRISYYAEYEQKKISQYVKDCIEKGLEYDDVFDFKKHNGEKIIVRSIGKPIYNQEGEIVLLRGSFQDITAEKEIERQLEEERLKTQQSSKLATLGVMSAGIAHEINNPLSIISGYSNMLSKKDLSGEMRAECIDKIKKSVDRISKIVNGLRKFSRSSESLQLAEVKLFSLVKESIDLVMTKSKKHNVEVRNLVDEQIILNIDEIQIEQVLINLISNAIDANDSHDQAWVEISNDSNNDFDLIIVKDSGQGIKEKDVDRLFDPFFTTKDIGKGTGLGLSVSQSIAKEHGGNLYYQFLDGNTSFVLKIPKHQNKNVA